MTHRLAGKLLMKKPHTQPVSEEYYRAQSVLQWWYFDALLETGHRLMTFFLPRHPGKIAGHDVHTPLVDIVVRAPDGRTVRERRFFEPRDMTASSTGLDVRFGHDCSLRMRNAAGGPESPCYDLCVHAGEIDLGLELTPELPPWSPFGATGSVPRPLMMVARKSLFTRDRFQYTSFVPRGRSRGRLRIGGETIDADGLGYHEQGFANFELNELLPEWNWLHIEHPPWTILCGAARLPRGFPASGEGPRNGFALVARGSTCVLSSFDLSGLFVRWKQVNRRAPGSKDEGRMIWHAVTEARRLGFRMRIELEGKDVFEYLPFGNENGKKEEEAFWGLAIANAKVDIRCGSERVDFTTDAILETMFTGG